MLYMKTLMPGVARLIILRVVIGSLNQEIRLLPSYRLFINAMKNTTSFESKKTKSEKRIDKNHESLCTVSGMKYYGTLV